MLVFLGLSFGFGMEWIKIEVNWVLKNAPKIQSFYDMSFDQRVEAIKQLPKSQFYDYYNNHRHIDGLNHLSESQLVKFKWISTVVFCLVFFLLCNAILRLADIPYTRELFFGYLILFTIALGVFLIGKLIKVNFYPFARLIIGFLQSLIPAAIFVFVSFVKKNYE